MTINRLNKYISDSGFCSRRKADKLIEEGRVTINGKRAKLGDKVPDGAKVRVEKHLIDPDKKQEVYIVFHKPIGVISTLDTSADNSVLDYVDIGERIFYVGRLDVASSGLMLMTNNGDLANKITKSGDSHDKEYIVTVDKKMTRAFIDEMKAGVVIDGKRTKKARVRKLSDNRFELIITEGRNKQIRKMCKALGYNVKKLRRTRIMNIKLGDLGAGNWRHLTKRERRELLNLI